MPSFSTSERAAELNTLQDELDEETKCISRATALAKDHFLSRAVKTLYADKVAKTTPQVIAHLQSKHPQENATAQKRPQDRCVSIDAEEFKIAVDRLPNGASPGWSGWTKELLSAAIKADSSIVAPLSALCTSLLHGTATEHFTRALLIGKLIGIEKPTNTPQSMDLRPITISDTFLKLSGSVALARTEFALPKFQRGVRHPGGCVQVVHEINSHLAAHPTQCLLALDVENAFCSISRQALWTWLESQTSPELKHYFCSVYGNATQLFLPGEAMARVISSSRVRQGDLTSSYIFAAAYSNALEAARLSLASKDIELSLWAYLDDCTICCEHIHITEVLQAVQTELAKLRLRLNMKKCELLCSPSCTQQCEHNNLHCVKVEVAKVLGCPISHDPQLITDFCLQKTEKSERFFKLVSSPLLQPALAVTLLRMCGLPKFTFLCRCVLPALLLPAAELFDQKVLRSAMKILGGANPTLLRVPAGLGLTPFTLMSPLLFAAAQSSVAGIAHDMPVEALVKRLLEESPPRIQRIAEVQHTSISGAWVNFNPTPHVLFRPQHQLIALRLRCGCTDDAPSKCPCGLRSPSVQHIMYCGKLLGFDSTQRHNTVCSSFCRVLRSFGISAGQEPTGLHPHLRPDILISGATHSVAIDVSIVDPLSDTHQAEDVDALIAGREAEKIEKYTPISTSSMLFFPLVLSAQGCWGSCALNCVARICSMFCLNMNMRAQLKKELLLAVSCALQVGNARMVEKIEKLGSQDGLPWIV